jgi:hypothetical protein
MVNQTLSVPLPDHRRFATAPHEMAASVLAGELVKQVEVNLHGMPLQIFKKSKRGESQLFVNNIGSGNEGTQVWPNDHYSSKEQKLDPDFYLNALSSALNQEALSPYGEGAAIALLGIEASTQIQPHGEIKPRSMTGAALSLYRNGIVEGWKSTAREATAFALATERLVRDNSGKTMCLKYENAHTTSEMDGCVHAISDGPMTIGVFADNKNAAAEEIFEQAASAKGQIENVFTYDPSNQEFVRETLSPLHTLGLLESLRPSERGMSWHERIIERTGIDPLRGLDGKSTATTLAPSHLTRLAFEGSERSKSQKVGRTQPTRKANAR